MTNIESIYKVICMEHIYVSFLLNYIIFVFLILFTLHLILYLTMNIIRLLLYHANTISYNKNCILSKISITDFWYYIIFLHWNIYFKSYCVQKRQEPIK